jgi:hypothetical protein
MGSIWNKNVSCGRCRHGKLRVALLSGYLRKPTRPHLGGPVSTCCVHTIATGHVDWGGRPIGPGLATGLPGLQAPTSSWRHQVHLHAAFRYVRPAGLRHGGRFDKSFVFWFDEAPQAVQSQQQVASCVQDGTTHVVWARGRGPLFRLEGLNVSGAAHSGMQRAQLLKNSRPPPSHPRDTWRHDILNSEVKVPADDTTYWCHVHRLPPALRTKHHVVQVGTTVRIAACGSVHEASVLTVVFPTVRGSDPAWERATGAPHRGVPLRGTIHPQYARVPRTLLLTRETRGH